MATADATSKRPLKSGIGLPDSEGLLDSAAVTRLRPRRDHHVLLAILPMTLAGLERFAPVLELLDRGQIADR